MSFKCKCEYTFCKKHRLPENHECEFDFQTHGKDILKKNIQKVQKNQLDTI